MFYKYRLMFAGHTKDIMFLVKLSSKQAQNVINNKGANNMAYIGAS